MAENYANAKDVLPPDLLERVQKHYAGLLWIPDDHDFYRERIKQIRSLREQGLTIKAIADQVDLSERRIWQLLDNENPEIILK